VQALVREVAYASLARADRRARHLAAARHVESLGTEELAGVLASHYFAAYQASKPGAEADALAAQARISLQAAAERAAALNSHRQARGYFEQAITVTSDPAEQAVLHLRAGEMGEKTFDMDAAIEHARAARELYRSLGDLPGVVRATTSLGRHQTSSKLEPQAIATLDEGLRDGEPIADSPEVAALLAELSRVYMMTNRHEEAIATADRSLELSGRHGLVLPVVEALVNKGTALENAGRITEAVATLRGAIVEAERHGLTPECAEGTEQPARRHLPGRPERGEGPAPGGIRAVAPTRPDGLPAAVPLPAGGSIHPDGRLGRMDGRDGRHGGGRATSSLLPGRLCRSARHSGGSAR